MNTDALLPLHHMRGNQNAPGNVRQGVLEEKARIEKLENENYELKLKIRLLERRFPVSAPPAPQLETSASKQLKDTLVQVQARNKELENENSKFKNQIASLPNRIAAKYQKTVNDYYEQVRADLIAKRKLEIKLAQLESERVITTPPPQMATANELVSPIIDQLNRELAAARLSKIELESQVETLKSEISEASKKFQTVEEQLHSALAALESATKPQPETQVPDLQLAANYKKLSLAHDSSLDENKQLQEKIDYLERVNDDLSRELSSLKKRAAPDLGEMEELESGYQSTIRALELQLANLRHESRTTVASHELTVAKNELSSANVKVAELNGQVTALENELRKAKLHTQLSENKISNLETKLRQRKDTDMRILNQKAELAKELESSKLQRVELEGTTLSLRTNLERESRARHTIELRNTELEHALTRQNDTARVIESSRKHPSQKLDSLYGKENTKLFGATSTHTTEKFAFAENASRPSSKDVLQALGDRLGISGDNA